MAEDKNEKINRAREKIFRRKTHFEGSKKFNNYSTKIQDFPSNAKKGGKSRVGGKLKQPFTETRLKGLTVQQEKWGEVVFHQGKNYRKVGNRRPLLNKNHGRRRKGGETSLTGSHWGVSGGSGSQEKVKMDEERGSLFTSRKMRGGE